MTTVADRLDAVRARVAAACARVRRDPSEVAIVAVSKTKPPEHVRAAYAAGQRRFGENYVQELAAKADALRDLPDLRWHFIGHLQRNKVKDVLAAGAAVETVDRLKLARALDRLAAERERTVPVLLQVNVGGEAQKSGCAPSEVPELAAAVRALPHLELRGLMTVPPLGRSPEASRPHFAALRALAAKEGLTELSMGMSADLEVAVEEGATVLRIGTAIFGPRT